MFFGVVFVGVSVLGRMRGISFLSLLFYCIFFTCVTLYLLFTCRAHIQELPVTAQGTRGRCSTLHREANFYVIHRQRFCILYSHSSFTHTHFIPSPSHPWGRKEIDVKRFRFVRITLKRFWGSLLGIRGRSISLLTLTGFH